VSPDYGLEDTATLEELLLAHLDGLVVGGEPVARELLLPALDSEDPPRISAALWALLAEEELMGPRPVGALAGEAFSAISGLKLEGAYVEAEGEKEPLPPLEEDLARDLEPRPEDALPVPARAAVATWWKEARKDFARGTRFLRGRAFSLDGLLEEMEHGSMRRRHVLAVEFALRSQGACQLQTRAFTQLQHAELTRAREMRGRLSASPFPRMSGG
jgi:hypothetical protein